jgi:hypothetical protein
MKSQALYVPKNPFGLPKSTFGVPKGAVQHQKKCVYFFVYKSPCFSNTLGAIKVLKTFCWLKNDQNMLHFETKYFVILLF